MPRRLLCAVLVGRASLVSVIVLSALSLAPLLWGAGPAQAVSADWVISASPTTLVAGQPNTVSITVTAGGQQIGRIELMIPGEDLVVGATVISVPAGGWSAAPIQGGSPTVVAFMASSGSLKLADGETGVFSISVVPSEPGQESWAVDAYETITSSSQSIGPPTAPLPMFTIQQGATESPTPTLTPTPTPTPTPTAAPSTSPTPTATASPTAATTPTATPVPKATLASTPGLTPSPAPAVATPRASNTSGPVRSLGPAPTAQPVPTQPLDPTPTSAASFSAPNATPATASPSPLVAAVTRGGIESPPEGGSGLPPSGAFHVSGPAGGGTVGAFASFGPVTLFEAFRWLVPSFVLGVPGFLVIVVVLAQLVGGGAFLPITRRVLGPVSRRQRRRA